MTTAPSNYSSTLTPITTTHTPPNQQPHTTIQQTHTPIGGLAHTQINGLEPLEARQIFINDISGDTTTSDLRNLFQSAGKVTNVEIDTNELNRHFAFVTFESSQGVQQAISKFTTTNLNNTTLVCRRRTELEQMRQKRMIEARCKLFVGNIPQQMPPGELRREIQRLSQRPIADFRHKKGYCFVGYNTPQDAEDAKRNLKNAMCGGKSLNAEFKKEDPIRNEPGFIAVLEQAQRTLYVRDIPPNTLPEKFKQIFETYGKVRKFTLPTESRSNKLVGYAFIEYFWKKDCDNALQQTENLLIDGVQIEIRISDPPKDKAKGGGDEMNNRRNNRHNRNDRNSRDHNRMGRDRHDRGRDDRGGRRNSRFNRNRSRSRSRSRSRERGGSRYGNNHSYQPPANPYPNPYGQAALPPNPYAAPANRYNPMAPQAPPPYGAAPAVAYNSAVQAAQYNPYARQPTTPGLNATGTTTTGQAPVTPANPYAPNPYGYNYNAYSYPPYGVPPPQVPPTTATQPQTTSTPPNGATTTQQTTPPNTSTSTTTPTQPPQYATQPYAYPPPQVQGATSTANTGGTTTNTQTKVENSGAANGQSTGTTNTANTQASAYNYYAQQPGAYANYYQQQAAAAKTQPPTQQPYAYPQQNYPYTNRY